jgi:predicted acyltransferase
MAHLFKFNQIGDIFVGGLCRFLPPAVGNFIQAVAAMMVMWAIMYYMYRKRTFIKV